MNEETRIANDLEQIAYSLTAVGGVVNPEGFHLLCVDGNDLIEELWDTSKVTSEARVASGVKRNAPAAYMIATKDGHGYADRRLVFSVDTDNTIKCYAYNYDDEKWQPIDLGDAEGVSVHPQSALTTDTSDPDGICVFFVNEDQKLQMLIERENSWKIGDTLTDARPRAGTTLSTVATDHDLTVFYLGEDDVMHYHVKTFDTGEWRDYTWPALTVRCPVSRFKVSPLLGTEDSELEAYLLTEGKFARCVGTSEKAEVGSVQGRNFTPNNTASCVRRTFLSGPSFRNGRLRGWSETRRKTRYYRNGGYRVTYSKRFYPIKK